MDNRSFDGCKLVNEFNYDDLGRMDRKRTYYEESGSPKTGYVSDYTHYTFDDLNRITKVETSPNGTSKTTRMIYTYDDTNHCMEANDPINNKIKKYYDGLDRVIEEEAFKATSTRISKKEYEYHPVFKDRVEKTTIYKDSEHTSTHIVETLYDPYERPVSKEVNNKLVKKISYDDLNNIITETYFSDNETFPTFSMKRMDMDWNGNTVKIKEWAMLKPNPLYDSAVITEYTYDLAGNCISMENDSGEEFKFRPTSIMNLFQL